MRDKLGRFKSDQLTNSERFWKYVRTSDDCWIWTGCRINGGYGQFGVCMPDGTWEKVMAHRFAYELLIGPIPEGLVLDHIECENPPCVNPGHTIICTNVQNVMRGKSPAALNIHKTHCKRGHLFSKENTLLFGLNGKGRACKTCHRMRLRVYYLRKRPNARRYQGRLEVDPISFESF